MLQACRERAKRDERNRRQSRLVTPCRSRLDEGARRARSDKLYGVPSKYEAHGVRNVPNPRGLAPRYDPVQHFAVDPILRDAVQESITASYTRSARDSVFIILHATNDRMRRVL